MESPEDAPPDWTRWYVGSVEDIEPPFDTSPGSEVTPEVFRKWRSPRRGTSNPQRMNNPVWHWLARSRIDAYAATKAMRRASPFTAGPGWCNDRFGQSATVLPDGRLVLIAGEHEDHYDPDFYIYNDVIVISPGGAIAIFGYPEGIFPPTDFHSATMVGDQIVLVGRLGYGEPEVVETPVFLLDWNTFVISRRPTTGHSPGWLHRHTAELAPDGASILIRGGVLGLPDHRLRDNIDDWRLRLGEWRWERLTDRRWPSWSVEREDRKSHSLSEIGWALQSRDWRWTAQLKEETATIRRAVGAAPDLDLAARLYRPPVPHAVLPEQEGEFGVHRIGVDGVVVKYREDPRAVSVRIEGELPAATVKSLLDDFAAKLSRLENTQIVVHALAS